MLMLQYEEGLFMDKELTEAVDQFLQKLTPQYLESEIWGLLHNSPDMDGGIDAYRLVRYFLKQPDLNDAQTGWAYQKIRPVFINFFDQIPSLYYFTGD
jgi:hypothetical protein